MQHQDTHSISKFHDWVKKELIQKKFISPWGIPVLILFACGGGILAANDLFFVPLAFAALLIGIVLIYYCLFQPLIGFYIVNFASFFLFFPNHLLGRDLLPLSSGLELMIFFLFIGTYISKRSEATHGIALMKTIVSIVLLLNTAYVAIEIFNPNVYGFGSWFAAFKRWVIFILIYLCAYRIIDTKDKFRFFIKFWLIMSFITALYGCYQQWFGYLPMELAYIMNTPGAFELLYQGGQLRKFSFLSEVVSFGVLSGSMAVMALILGINEKEKWRRFRLFFFFVIMALGMAYSGTRTTTIMIPAGLVLYGFVTIQNKATLITLFAAVMVAMVVMFAPIYSNPTLNRVRTTFDSKDESMNLRDRNRAYIRPYLLSHPIGGGIGTTNFAGLYNHPYHPLAGFPTDSGFLKIGLEMGWIGLILLIFFNLSILYQGIVYYFKMYNKELRIYMVVIICTLFPILVAQYSQETVGQFPGGVFFFSSLSLMKRLLEFDQAERRPA